MKALRKTNKNGFTYIVAIAMLGLMAFMGIFLMQSSSSEYSQTALSVYRTMAKQIAESAAEEASIALEEQFKNKDSKAFDYLMKKAASSVSKRADNGTSKVYFNILDIFPDVKDKIEQTNYLRECQISRAGFVIESIDATIEDIRPIPQGPLDFDACYYRPTDRVSESGDVNKPFDTGMSKDWYCSLVIHVKVSLQKQRKFTVNYRMAKDIKVLNLGPIARNYSFYSILGVYIPNYADQATIESCVKNNLNSGGGPNEN